jgi:transposase-like protein
MKNTPSIIDVVRDFPDEKKCHDYMETMRWPEGVRCVTCGCDRVSKITSSSKKQNVRYLYQCLETTCKQQFSVTSGTIMHDSHLPLRTWFLAVALVCNAKKGLSAMQMQRDLGVSYRTAWYLNHRIRKSMEEGTGLFTGIVEADETYIGGRYDRRRQRAPHDKIPVFGALQRGKNGETSKVRAFPVRPVSAITISSAVQETISKTAVLVTDEHRAYRAVGKLYKGHERVNHIALEYVRKSDKAVHTNSIENFWSLFKRGVIGQYHQVSEKHLHRYLDEFTFRFNNREAADLFALVLINLAIKQGIQYKELTAKASGPELL